MVLEFNVLLNLTISYGALIKLGEIKQLLPLEALGSGITDAKGTLFSVVNIRAASLKRDHPSAMM